MTRLLALSFALSFSSAAQAADIALECVSGDWSAASTWVGGVAPTAADTGYRQIFTCGNGFSQVITLDAAAASPLGSFVPQLNWPAGQNGGGITLDVGVNTTFDGDVYLREGTLTDNGNDLTVNGTLTNCGNGSCAYLNGEGNGMVSVRGGGNIHATSVRMQRATSFEWRPGDTVTDYFSECLSQRNICPNVIVSQDDVAYSATTGLSIEGPGAFLNLDSYGPGVNEQAKLVLTFDTAPTAGGLDWALRWQGDHVAELLAYEANGQIQINQLPSNVAAFNPSQHIFYDAGTGFTYVGFGGPSLTVLATMPSCPTASPSPMALIWNTATPGGNVRVAAGTPGSTALPTGPCAGTVVPLAAIGYAVAPSSPGGTGIFQSSNAPSSLCGLSVVVVDESTCEVSNISVLR